MPFGKSIFVISTDATRTGTPVLLLSQLRWLRENSNYQFVILLHTGGVLLEEFQRIGEVHLWHDIEKQPLVASKKDSFVFGLINRITSYQNRQSRKKFINDLKKRHSIDLIFSNSARNGYILSLLRNSGGVRRCGDKHDQSAKIQAARDSSSTLLR